MIPAEAIERVIDDLETRVEKFAPFRKKVQTAEILCEAYEYAISELRKVLEDYAR